MFFPSHPWHVFPTESLIPGKNLGEEHVFFRNTDQRSVSLPNRRGPRPAQTYNQLLQNSIYQVPLKPIVSAGREEISDPPGPERFFHAFPSDFDTFSYSDIFPELACFFPLPLRGRGKKILPFFPIPLESEERPSPQISLESEGTRSRGKYRKKGPSFAVENRRGPRSEIGGLGGGF